MRSPGLPRRALCFHCGLLPRWLAKLARDLRMHKRLERSGGLTRDRRCARLAKTRGKHEGAISIESCRTIGHRGSDAELLVRRQERWPHAQDGRCDDGPRDLVHRLLDQTATAVEPFWRGTLVEAFTQGYTWGVGVSRHCGRNSVGRMPASQAGRRRFESGRPLLRAP